MRKTLDDDFRLAALVECALRLGHPPSLRPKPKLRIAVDLPPFPNSFRLALYTCTAFFRPGARRRG